MPKLGPFSCQTITSQNNILFDQSLCYEDTEIHCVEIAVLRKLKDFVLFLFATITFWGIILTLSMSLLGRT
jgi:hypothetical protein